VLLAYVLYDPMVSYTQGMTDLLAPLLLSLEDEVMAFWCFTRLVEQSVFFKPASVSICMESQLVSFDKQQIIRCTGLTHCSNEFCSVLNGFGVYVVISVCFTENIETINTAVTASVLPVP